MIGSSESLWATEGRAKLGVSRTGLSVVIINDRFRHLCLQSDLPRARYFNPWFRTERCRYHGNLPALRWPSASGIRLGTNLTNDFIGRHPAGAQIMSPISIVVKVGSVNGHPAVKLSDHQKAIGPAEEVALYQAVFGSDGIGTASLRV